MGNTFNKCEYNEPTYTTCKDGKLTKTLKSKDGKCKNLISSQPCILKESACVYDKDQDKFIKGINSLSKTGSILKTDIKVCKDCKFGKWSEWSECKDGLMSRTRTTADVEDCKKHATQTKECVECLLPKKTEECKLEDNGNMWYKYVTDIIHSKTIDTGCCDFGEWSEWSECKDGKTSRTRPTTNKSADCVKASVEVKDCAPCNDGAWGECKPDPERGASQRRTYSVWDTKSGTCANKEDIRTCAECKYDVTYSDCSPNDTQDVYSELVQGGNSLCAKTLNKTTLTPCKCKWGAWGAWSVCKDNTTSRSRSAPGCNSMVQTAYCTPCTAGVWTDWSICERNPETGVFEQRRVLGADEYWDESVGYCKINNDKVETKTCNEIPDYTTCKYTYGNWSECKDGKTERTLYTTVQGCTNKQETKSCTPCVPGAWVPTGTCNGVNTKIRSTLRNNYIWDPKLGACKVVIQYKEDICPPSDTK
jgi:hypothetical protein